MCGNKALAYRRRRGATEPSSKLNAVALDYILPSARAPMAKHSTWRTYVQSDRFL